MENCGSAVNVRSDFLRGLLINHDTPPDTSHYPIETRSPPWASQIPGQAPRNTVLIIPDFPPSRQGGRASALPSRSHTPSVGTRKAKNLRRALSSARQKLAAKQMLPQESLLSEQQAGFPADALGGGAQLFQGTVLNLA